MVDELDELDEDEQDELFENNNFSYSDNKKIGSFHSGYDLDNVIIP